MSDIFANGRVIDLILALVVVEAIALTLYHRRTGAGIAPAHMASLLIPGVFLLLAIRAALSDAAWHWTALYLLVAFMAHIADIAQRWRN